MISVVIPVYNEEESIRAFYKELTDSLSKLRDKSEILFVDDGSTDNTLSLLKELLYKDSKNLNIRIFSFRKNQGKSEALSLGFQKAKGDYVVTLDADLQDKPEEIGKLLDRVKKENWDLVCGWRKKRNDPTAKVMSSKLFNFLASRFWGLNLHDYNCGLKVYKKDAAKSIFLYGGMYRFIPLLVYQEGFRVGEVPVAHSKRMFGKSKYGFSKLWKDLPDIFTMLFLSKYSKRPMHLFGFFGIVFILLGLIISIYLTINHFQGHRIGERPILFLGMLLLIAGFQFLFTGFLADLITNLFHNSYFGNGNSKEGEYREFN